jgi:hypothetical protein
MVLLRLNPEDLTKPIDFREGGWGHRLHSTTFRRLRPHKVRLWPFLPWPKVNEPESVRRISFMAHTSVTPTIGREVIWATKDGSRRGRIYEVERCTDPRDMMTLKVVVTAAPTGEE